MANWTAHIHVVALDFGLRNPDLTDARTARALVTGSAGFYFFHTGYRINALFNEVYGARAARYMESGGFRLMRDWQGNNRTGLENSHKTTILTFLRSAAIWS